MPAYAFICEDCGEFERIRRIDDRDAPMACPQCGEDARRIATAGRLLGSGDGSGGAEGSYQRMRHAGGCRCCP